MDKRDTKEAVDIMDIMDRRGKKNIIDYLG